MCAVRTRKISCPAPWYSPPKALDTLHQRLRLHVRGLSNLLDGCGMDVASGRPRSPFARMRASPPLPSARSPRSWRICCPLAEELQLAGFVGGAEFLQQQSEAGFLLVDRPGGERRDQRRTHASWLLCPMLPIRRSRSEKPIRRTIVRLPVRRTLQRNVPVVVEIGKQASIASGR